MTPPEVLIDVRRFADMASYMGPKIALDPATFPHNPTSAEKFFTVEDDGLAQDWTTSGVAFNNPPYGRVIKDWVLKANRKEAYCCLQLVPARTDTKWFQTSGFDACLFYRGRLKFIDPNTGEPSGTAPFPSALLLYIGAKGLVRGKVLGDFEHVFSPQGRVWIP